VLSMSSSASSWVRRGWRRSLSLAKRFQSSFSPTLLAKRCRDFQGGAGTVRKEGPVKRHDVAVSGLTIGPEEEEGQVDVPAV